jgi:hypothetical protein
MTTVYSAAIPERVSERGSGMFFCMFSENDRKSNPATILGGRRYQVGNRTCARIL